MLSENSKISRIIYDDWGQANKKASEFYFTSDFWLWALPLPNTYSLYSIVIDWVFKCRVERKLNKAFCQIFGIFTDISKSREAGGALWNVEKSSKLAKNEEKHLHFR